ncbi:MAG: hypothetical protein AAFS07_16770 [Pseudomonadota bacterium]
MKRNNERVQSEAFYLKNISSRVWVLYTEPTSRPSSLRLGKLLKVEFIGGAVADNLQLSISDEFLHLEERDEPHAADFRYFGESDNPDGDPIT